MGIPMKRSEVQLKLSAQLKAKDKLEQGKMHRQHSIFANFNQI
jgi:hypothetical protein